MYSDIRIRFGSRLRAMRKKHGWTQAEMADVLSPDRSYLSEIEEGKRNVFLRNVGVIAIAWGFSCRSCLPPV